MSSNQLNTQLAVQDSITPLPIKDDTVSAAPALPEPPDTTAVAISPEEDTLSVLPKPQPKKIDTLPPKSPEPREAVKLTEQTDFKVDKIKYLSESDNTNNTEPEIAFENFSLFANNDSTIVSVKPGNFLRVATHQQLSSPGSFEKLIHESKLSHLNWTLLVGLLCVILLLVLKSYYKKLTSRIVNTLVNFQLADKMLREKNIIVRRAFFIMNLNYILVISLFILLLTFYFQFRITSKFPLDYLLIIAVITGLMLVRLLVYYTTGYLFERLPSVIEHIHMIYLVNKNLGLVLLPVSFVAIYTETKIAEILLIIGIGILAIATVYKLVRGFQIIFRSGVLLFYAILYLCTLEVLPLLLGAKLIISLR